MIKATYLNIIRSSVKWQTWSITYIHVKFLHVFISLKLFFWNPQVLNLNTSNLLCISNLLFICSYVYKFIAHFKTKLRRVKDKRKVVCTVFLSSMCNFFFLFFELIKTLSEVLSQIQNVLNFNLPNRTNIIITKHWL